MTPEQFAEHMAELRAIRTALESRPALAPAQPSIASPASNGSGSGAVFPNYGRSKGQPVAGASMGDLEFYANGCRRTLADPGKSRFHGKERELLVAIESEIARQTGRSAVPAHDPGTGEVIPDFGSDDGIPF